MERLKQVILQHFERIMVGIILLAAFMGTYLIEEKWVVLNFFYLPVLVASYFLGRRMGLLTAVFSILIITICALVFPESFFKGETIFDILTKLSS